MPLIDLTVTVPSREEPRPWLPTGMHETRRFILYYDASAVILPKYKRCKLGLEEVSDLKGADLPTATDKLSVPPLFMFFSYVRIILKPLFDFFSFPKFSRMIKDRSLDLVRQILLFYIVVRIIMGIPVPNAMTQILVSSIMGILETCRYRRPFCLDALHCFGDRHYRRIALRCGRHVEHCLGENNLGLRHPDPLHSLGRGYRHRKCMGSAFPTSSEAQIIILRAIKRISSPCVEHLCHDNRPPHPDQIPRILLMNAEIVS